MVVECVDVMLVIFVVSIIHLLLLDMSKEALFIKKIIWNLFLKTFPWSFLYKEQTSPLISQLFKPKSILTLSPLPSPFFFQARRLDISKLAITVLVGGDIKTFQNF